MRPLRYRMLVTDLDGTLLGHESAISPRNAAALAAVRARGVSIVYATGRAYRETVEPLGEHLQAVSQGSGGGAHVVGAGGATVHVAGGTLLDSFPMREDAVRACAAVINAHGHVAHLLHDKSHDDHDYSMVGTGDLDDATTWWIDRFGLRHRWHDCLPDAVSQTMRVSAVAGELEIAPIASEVAQRCRHAVTLRHWPAMTSGAAVGSAPHMLEIHAAGVDKWTATECVCVRTGIAPEEVVALGDGPNDVELLSKSGLGIAMGDGWEVAKSAADEVAPPCTSDGFAQAVERLLAEGRL
ncbi:MAG: HAD family hydrolase [Planctomycetota bacterium]|nr:HAD family hydrolase [Planctomycetota bacterium]MDA1105526.1 HAD family hydrolase [Planctomycetota bacterium]